MMTSWATLSGLRACLGYLIHWWSPAAFLVANEELPERVTWQELFRPSIRLIWPNSELLDSLRPEVCFLGQSVTETLKIACCPCGSKWRSCFLSANHLPFKILEKNIHFDYTLTVWHSQFVEYDNAHSCFIHFLKGYISTWKCIALPVYPGLKKAWLQLEL